MEHKFDRQMLGSVLASMLFIADTFGTVEANSANLSNSPL